MQKRNYLDTYFLTEKIQEGSQQKIKNKKKYFHIFFRPIIRISNENNVCICKIDYV